MGSRSANGAAAHQNRAKTCVSEPFRPATTNSRNNSFINSLPHHQTTRTHQQHSATKRNDSSQTPSVAHSARLSKMSHNEGRSQSTMSMANVPINAKDSFGQDVRSTVAPSNSSIQSGSLSQNVNVVQVATSEILRRCDQSDPKDVYEISLRAERLVRIENLDEFTKLRSLDLSGNYITTIENLQNNLELRELKLYDNKIVHINHLERLKDLTLLHLQHNLIHCVGNGLRSLVRLRALRLDNNRIPRLDAQELSSCLQLTSLDISNNYLENIAAVGCLPNLEELYARHNNFKKLCDLSRCKKLQEVDVSYNPLSDLSGLRDSLSLRCLNVSHCQLSSFSTLGKLIDLEELNSSHCQLRSVKALSQYFPSLQILSISNNLIASKDDLSSLKSMSELVELSVDGNPFCNHLPTGDALISAIHVLLPNLHMLDSMNLIEMSSRPLSTPMALGPKSDPNLNSQIIMETPLTRPSSASSKVGEKFMEKQLNEIETQLKSFEAEFSMRIQNLKTSIKVLPDSIRSSREGSERSDSMQSSLSTKQSRPPSRCRTRSRLEDAMTFAEHHFRSS